MTSSNIDKTFLLFISALICVGFIAFSYNEKNKRLIPNIPSIDTPQSQSIQPEKNTISKAWDWNEFPEEEKIRSQQETKIFDKSYNTVINPSYLYKVLKNVELTENGDVVLDHKALQALQLTLNRGRLRLDIQGLGELQDMIKTGLPGKSGEQTADVVANFYNFLDAKDELGLYQQPPTSDIEQREQYQELVAVRELFLSEGVANSLFKQTDANAEFMFSILSLESDFHTDEKDKQKLVEKYTETLITNLVSITDWEERYKKFKESKKTHGIKMNGDINNINHEAILSQHFTQEEINQLNELNLVSML